MPKKILKLSKFDRGIIGNASPRDIPPDAMSYGKNIDSRERGVVQGIPENTSISASFDARVMAPLVGPTNYLLGQDSSKQFKTYDIDGDTVSNVGSTTTNYARQIVPLTDLAFVATSTTFRGDTPGAPLWVGEVENTPFGVGSSGFIVDQAECRSFADNNEGGNATTPYISLSAARGTMVASKYTDSTYAYPLGEGSSSVFQADTTYFYAVSLVYDGFQESPLIKRKANGDYFRFGNDTDDWGSLLVTLQVAFDTDLPKRVTGFKVYRATAAQNATAPESEYRLVFTQEAQTGNDLEYVDYEETLQSAVSATDDRFEVSDTLKFMDGDKVRIDNEEVTVASISGSDVVIEGTFSSGHTSGTTIEIGTGDFYESGTNIIGWDTSLSATNHYMIVFHDTGAQGATYTDNTGVADTLETTSVDYLIAAEYSNYLFVSGASKDDIDGSEKYVFRSQARTFSVIDWANDFVILPEQPVALAGYNGRLFAFSETNTYRINPLTMDLEDTYRGVGAFNENMVITTNYGMFHADKNNVYFNDGRTSTPIGTPILDNQEASNMGWQNLGLTETSQQTYASLGFDPTNRRLLCFVFRNGTQNAVWSYDVGQQRWDWYPDFGKVTTTTLGPSGNLYAVIGDTSAGFDLYTLFTSGTRKNWELRTKDFDFDSDTGFAYLYDISAFGSGDLEMDYRVNGSNILANPTVSTLVNESGPDNRIRQFTVASGDKKARSIIIEVSSASGSDRLDNITVQFRPMVIQQ